MAFMDKDFLLDSHLAVKLYHEVVENLPIIDYHCHLNAKDIYENKPFKSITDVWLNGDHYKWRFLRSFGVEESLVSFGEDEYSRFLAYAKHMPYAIGNPLYHWTHLELKRFFKTDLLLNEKNAKSIYEITNQKITQTRPSDILKHFNVSVIGTTDDPVDDLKYHTLLKNSQLDYKVIPTFRPDKALHIELPSFNPWIKQLEEVTQIKITDISSLEDALLNRMIFFNDNGCKSSDHSFNHIMFVKTTKEEVNYILIKALQDDHITELELKKYKGYMLTYLGRCYKKLNWVQQYHIGALRNVNELIYHRYGADYGYDSMNDQGFIEQLSQLLNEQEKTNELPKTILYTLNPAFNEAIVSLSGSFHETGIRQKVQFGSGWWFNDQLDGMNRQLEAYSQMSFLTNFVGMTTDSRSFLSYVRHEYFRRLVTNKLAKLVESGQYPDDFDTLSEIAKGICYKNAVSYFDI